MSLLDAVRHRLYVLARGERYAREQEDELAFHLELDRQTRQSGSEHADDDARAAVRAFGNRGYYREEMRNMTSLAWMDRLRQNTGYALRGMRRSPGFTAIVVVTLALGAGANGAMFSLVDRFLLRAPAAVADPGTLHRLYIDPGYAVSKHGSHVFGHFSYANYIAVRDAGRSVDPAIGVAAYTPADSFGLGEHGELPVRASFVSSNYFEVLGLPAMVGRTFGADESGIDSPTPVIVISDRLWRDAFGARKDVVGSRARLGGAAYTVIGVAAPGFAGVDVSATDIWIPLNGFAAGALRATERLAWTASGAGNYFAAVARIPLGAPTAEFAGRAASSLRALRTALTGKPDPSRLLTGPIIEARGPAEAPDELTVTTRVAGVSVILLIIACLNVATLLLVRARQRHHELAIRRALGVSRARLLEQLMTESLVLALFGGAIAVGVAEVVGRIVRRLLFPATSWPGAVVDQRVLGYVAVVVIIAGVLAALGPGLGAMRRDVMDGLRIGSSRGSGPRWRFGSLLLGTQAALSLVLLVAAALFVRSRSNVEQIDLGYDASRIVFGVLTRTPDNRWGPETTPRLALVANAMRSAPGVQGAALTSPAPMGGYAVQPVFRPTGDSLSRIGGDFPTYASVTPEFFHTAGVGLVAGRTFAASDGPESAPVVVVDEKMAHLVWPNQSPLGQCLVLGKLGAPCVTVVGVVRDTHRMNIIDAPRLQYYRPMSQQAGFTSPTIILRVAPAQAAQAKRALAAALAREFSATPPAKVMSLTQLLEPQLRPWRLAAELATALSTLALIVAAVGIYSVVAFGVLERTKEIGVRVAIGAQTRDILDLIVNDGIGLVAVGIGAGIVLSLVAGRFIASLLFGVTSGDPSILIGSAALLTLVAIVASAIPAWRAARLDPVATLRAD
jgi:predicted permease